MRKLMLLGAMLAVMVVAATPAIAQVGQEFSERRITSGKASPSFSVSNKGNNVNLCPTGQQVVNTGNVANEQGVVQYASKSDDIDFSGSEIAIESSTSAECTQEIRQAAAAAPAKAAPAPAPAAAAPAPAAAAPAAAPAPAPAKAAPAPAKALPKTGGVDVAPLLGLGVGALLVAGALLARKIIR